MADYVEESNKIYVDVLLEVIEWVRFSVSGDHSLANADTGTAHEQVKSTVHLDR